MSEMNSQNNKTHQARLSRRSFINIALGSLTVVPALVTGAVPAGDLAPKKAYAAPTDATLKVASPSQVNIVLYDLTGGSGMRRIPNASIKVFHPNTNKTYDLNSGESGVATFDIAELADPAGLQKNPKQYKFYGSVEIRVDGYRAFRSGIMQFKGGTSVQAGTRRIEEGVPYPALCTFNQYDILYSVNEWVRSSQNKEKHTLEIELENAGTGSISFTLATTEGRTIATQTVTPSDGVAKFKLEGNYLDSGNAGSLPAGKKFVAKYSRNGRNFQHNLHIKVANAPGDAQSSSLASVGSLAPILFNSLDMNMAITFPTAAPSSRRHSPTCPCTSASTRSVTRASRSARPSSASRAATAWEPCARRTRRPQRRRPRTRRLPRRSSTRPTSPSAWRTPTTSRRHPTPPPLSPRSLTQRSRPGSGIRARRSRTR